MGDIAICATEKRFLRFCFYYSVSSPSSPSRNNFFADAPLLTEGPCILVGDFNTHSPAWNPQCESRRDTGSLEELTDNLELRVLNDDTDNTEY